MGNPFDNDGMNIFQIKSSYDNNIIKYIFKLRTDLSHNGK